MTKKSIRFLVIFFVIVILSTFILTPNPLSQSKKKFLWKVQSKAATVYVLGSIHFLKKEMYPLDERIEKAFERSDVLVVEANLNEVGKVDMQKFIRAALYPEKDSLEKHLSAETYEWVKKELTEFGVPLEVANKQKPWFLALTLVSIEILKLGFDPNYGIDKHFLSKATGKKKILELESIDTQIDLFSNLSEKEQELYLLSTLKDLKVAEQEVNKLIEAWALGETTSMESIIMRKVKEDPRLSIIYEKFLYERNKNMVTKIEDYLKGKETYFVVVGAGHLVGNKGIIELLKGKGYLIEQL
jgi:uncharacterized protein YbaP (TraB family)